MTFPAAGTAGIATQAGATSHNVDLPTVSAGDTILIFLIRNIDRTIDIGSDLDGYTLKYNTSTSGVAVRLYEKLNASGSEPDFSYGTTGSGSCDSISVAFSVSGVDTSTGTESQTASGIFASPNPPSLTVSWGSDDNLWIVLAASRGSSQHTGLPSGYSSLGVDAETGTGSGNVAVLMGYLESAAATEDPGAFSPTTDRMVVSVTGIRPTTGGGGGTAVPVFYHHLRTMKAA